MWWLTGHEEDRPGLRRGNGVFVGESGFVDMAVRDEPWWY